MCEGLFPAQHLQTHRPKMHRLTHRIAWLWVPSEPIQTTFQMSCPLHVQQTPRIGASNFVSVTHHPKLDLHLRRFAPLNQPLGSRPVRSGLRRCEKSPKDPGSCGNFHVIFASLRPEATACASRGAGGRTPSTSKKSKRRRDVDVGVHQKVPSPWDDHWWKATLKMIIRTKWASYPQSFGPHHTAAFWTWNFGHVKKQLRGCWSVLSCNFLEARSKFREKVPFEREPRSPRRVERAQFWRVFGRVFLVGRQ